MALMSPAGTAMTSAMSVEMTANSMVAGSAVEISVNTGLFDQSDKPPSNLASPHTQLPYCVTRGRLSPCFSRKSASSTSSIFVGSPRDR